MQNVEKVNCVELTVVEGRCVYLNNHRIAGNKPYVSENLRHSFYQVPVADVLSALGSTIEQSSIVAATVKQDLTVELVSNRYKLDFDDLERWALDGCPEGVSGKVQDVFALIEAARQLQADDLRKRMSDAVTLLYTHGILTEKMRAHCRSRLA